MTKEEQNVLNKELFNVLFEPEPTDKIIALIDRGADVNARDNEGRSVLMHLCSNSMEPAEEATITLLIEKGADVNARDNKGRSVLDNTLYFNNLRTLIRCGADVNARDSMGRTALMKGSSGKRADAYIRAGADVNARDNDGNTPLMYCFRSGTETEKVLRLLKHGADVNAQNNNGETALMLALQQYGYSNSDEMISILLDYADLSIKDNKGKTASDYATEYDSPYIDLIKSHSETNNIPHNENHTDVKERIETRKKQILKSRRLRKLIEEHNPKERISGPVLADEIAENIISGKEERTITPEVAEEIKLQKSINIVSNEEDQVDTQKRISLPFKRRSRRLCR